MRYMWICLLLLSVVACSKSRRPLPDKTTSWLRACDRDAQCGSDLACLCGICSRTCDEAANCGGGTSCLSTSAREAKRACGDDPAAPRLCASPCTRDSQCRELGAEWSCLKGLCTGAARSKPSTTPCDEASCLPDQEIACTDGELNMKLCDYVRCTELNATAVTRCEGGHFQPCECVVPRDGCAALDCVAGYRCYEGRCLETARCGEQACEEGWSCWSSVCGQVLASEEHWPVALALDGDALYVANRGTFDTTGTFNRDASILRIDLSTGDRVQLADDKNSISELVVSDGSAYWFRERLDTWQLMSLRLSGGVPSALTDLPFPAGTLRADENHLYWFQGGPLYRGTTVMGGLKGEASEPWLITTLQSQPHTDFVPLHGQIYLADQQKLWRVNADGSELTQVAEPDQPGRWPRRLAADGAAIHWLWWDEEDEDKAAGTSMYTEGETRVETLGIDAVGRSTNAAFAIAVSSDTIFWLIGSEDGYVVLNRTDKRSGETRYVWGTQRLTLESRMVVDDDAIYLTNPGTRRDDGEVLRIINRW
jgi:hypothetical protein